MCSGKEIVGSEYLLECMYVCMLAGEEESCSEEGGKVEDYLSVSEQRLGERIAEGSILFKEGCEVVGIVLWLEWFNSIQINSSRFI